MPTDTKALHIPASFESLDASRFRRLDDVTIGVFDCPHSTPKLSDHGPLVVRTQDIMTGVLRVDQAARVSEETYRERIDRAEPEFGDLLYSREGTYFGIAAEVPSGTRLCLGQRMVLIRPDRAKVDHRYLKYWLNSPQIAGHILGFRDGSVAERLNLPVIRGLPVFVPELSEQQAIAETLGALDDKIEQNRRTGRALEGLARATFKAWFVDFEPVKAKAAGATRFPGLPPAAFAALPNRLTDSPLGPVPEGWEVKPIGDVVTVSGGGTPSTKDESFWIDGTHCWATPKDLSSLQHPILFSTERRITDAGVAKISSGVLPIDTVLLSSRAPVGYLAMAKVPTAVNQGFIAIECTGPFKPHYVLHWLHANMEEIKGRASGTTFAEISKSAFRPIPAVVPPPALVDAFEEATKPMFDLITQAMAESAKLAALRDYLLPRLLSGRVRVRVREAEARVEDIA